MSKVYLQNGHTYRGRITVGRFFAGDGTVKKKLAAAGFADPWAGDEDGVRRARARWDGETGWYDIPAGIADIEEV